MTTLTIHLDDEKSEQAVKAVLNALEIKYDESSNETVVFPDHVIAGVAKAKEDVKLGHVKEYKGLNAILGR